MKSLVIYSSLSGMTKRLAEGIFQALSGEKELSDLKTFSGSPADYDCIFAGYWVDKGGPNEEMKHFLSALKGKYVGVFATLGAFCDSAHAFQSIQAGVSLVKEQNTVLGSFICNGALSQKMIEMFQNAPADSHHRVTPQSKARWQVLSTHPTKAEIAHAGELFRERQEVLELLLSQKEALPEIH